MARRITTFFDVDNTLLENERAKHDLWAAFAAYLGPGGAERFDAIYEQVRKELGLVSLPLVLEARGLDVTPSLQEKLREAGDHETADILEIIYTDEKGHVGIGAKWFRFFCARDGHEPARHFGQLVRANFRGEVKPPFNVLARAEAGLTPLFYQALASTSS